PTQYSAGTVALSDTVNPVNDAPVLFTGPDMTAENEDGGPPVGAVGTLVGTIADLGGGGGADNIRDVDNVPLGTAVSGIALTAVDTTHGTWFYSLDNGANWLSVGAVDETRALLLAADTQTRLYFQSDPDFNGLVPAAITFRA